MALPNFDALREGAPTISLSVAPKSGICIVIGNLEVVVKVLLAAEFKGFEELLVIDRVVGEGPLVERSSLGSSH